MGIIARQSIKGTIVTYMGVAVGFLTTFFVLTRFLSAEEIGLARVLVDAATLFIGLAQLGTNTSIIRFYPYFKDVDTRDHGFFFYTLVVPLFGFLLFALVYWACHIPLGNWFGDKSPLFMDYYYMVLPLAFFMLYQTIFETNANVLMRIVVPRAVRELVVRIGMLALYLLYAFRILSMDGFVIGLCLNYAVAALVNLAYLFAVGHISLRPDWTFLRNNPSLVRNYLLYTGFLFISAVASVLAPALSSFFITAKMGLDSTGIYAIATYIAVMVSIPYRSVTAIASPQLAHAIKEQDRQGASRLIHQVSNNLLLVGGLIFLAIWFNIDLIFHLLPNGSTYAAAKNVVLILGINQIVIATFSICLSALSYSRFYVFSLFLSFFLTAASVCLNNYLIPLYGMDGAAMSNLIAYAVYFALVVLVLRCVCRVSVANRQTALAIALIIVLFALNALWLHCFPSTNIWLSSILRTVVLLGSGVAIAWLLQLSPELNKMAAVIFHHRK